MNLKEYQGKELFEQYGIKTPGGILIKKGETVPEAVYAMGPKVSIKAQVAKGKRKKAGGIVFVDNKKEIVEREVALIFDMKIGGLAVEEILIYGFVEASDFQYLALTIDRVEKCAMLVYCAEGGVDIEEIAGTEAKKIKKYQIKNIQGISKIKDQIPKKVLPILEKIYKLFSEKDCTLVEINPLAVRPDSSLIALDSKVVIDDNALFRHPELAKYKTDDYTPLEKEAKDAGMSYVELDGDIAVIGNGAGLVMATLDTLAHFGGKVANFLDVGGGANAEQMKKALTIALTKDGVKKIFINIFGGITRADEIAQGLVDFVKEKGLNIPVVLRVVGTREKEAKAILLKAGIKFEDEMEAAAKEIVKT